MTQSSAADDETADLLADNGFRLADTTQDTALPASDEFDEDEEFRPRQRTRIHWFTWLLIGLVIWGAGFLVGVLADRAIG